MSKIAYNKQGQFGENHHAWKANSVGYVALHSWVSRMLGRPNKCEDCGTTKAQKYEWANISKEYKRDLADWKRLCGKCHMKFDGYKRWVGHIKNSERKCFCGGVVWAKNLCKLHHQRQYRGERKKCLV